MAGKRKFPGMSSEVEAGDMERLLQEMADEMDISREDMALSKLLMAGMPAIADLASDDKLLPALVAIEPKLTMAELESCCAKIEDLAIALLASVRSERHAAKDAETSEGSGTQGSTLHGEEALEILESMQAQFDSDEIDFDADTPPLPPMMTPDMIAQNVTSIRAAMPGAKPRRQ